jgi:hypothetical protein
MSATATGRILSHERALEMSRRGNVVRRQRSQLKERLRAGNLHLARLLAETPGFAEGMSLEDALLALPRIYRGKAERAMLAAGIHGRPTVGSLTDRQRGALLAHFKLRHPSIWALWIVMARRANGT